MDSVDILPLVWFAVIAFGVFMYVLLDGFVLGIGILCGVAYGEAERDIIQTESNTPTVPGDPDPAEFRSLASDSESIELETTWNTTFGEGARVPSLSVNANLDRSFSRSLSGLDTVLLTDPDGNSQLRAIDDDPITRRTRSTTASLGSSFNAPIDDCCRCVRWFAAIGHVGEPGHCNGTLYQVIEGRL